MKLLLLFAITGAFARTFKVHNSCKFTVWPAIFTDLNVAPNIPNHPTGWEAKPGSSVTFHVPDNWKAGRIWGVPPATVAEWTLEADGNRDFYDVSLVDGFNFPMRITNNKGCPVADCPTDLNPECPSPLREPQDSSGNPETLQTVAPGTTVLRKPVLLRYYSYFKTNCRNAYAYAYDESSGTALWTCDAGLKANYTLTFCP
ncbi:Osmotin, thaumatin-like protein [Macrolepiota fuliginosa MF-IS2]|uniref:Osmotin, thaumatin-like protein n=1 Tax=Macrolepiota fuliginosa MF-IS2 TaxID=1400762 RepID=A0A9P5XBQ5_9AGAR|nr:Osmotin, thaumatin-like protein [Macrolepiota fuliginosa MF-IS2]